MRRIQKQPVRGISFKLQEEERERRDNFVPEVSALAMDRIEVDLETKNMLRSLSFADMAGIVAPADGGSMSEEGSGKHHHHKGGNTGRQRRQS